MEMKQLGNTDVTISAITRSKTIGRRSKADLSNYWLVKG
jgi:hypothetical protein